MEQRRTTMAIGDKLRAPEGYVLFGWWRSGGGIQSKVRESRVHLISDHDPKDRRPLCGVRSPARGANIERGDQVSYTVGYSDDRGVCERCYVVALSDTTHLLDIGRRRVVGGSPIRGGGNVYAVKAHCACGVTFGGTSATSREIRSEHRDHVVSVAREGLFRVLREGYEPMLATRATAAALTGHDVKDLATLVVGESVGGLPPGHRERYATAECVIEAVIPDG